LAGIFGIIGSIAERTGPDDYNVGDELNLHGAAKQIGGWPFLVNLTEQPNFRLSRDTTTIGQQASAAC
jgi:hypothetical protein